MFWKSESVTIADKRNVSPNIAGSVWLGVGVRFESFLPKAFWILFALLLFPKFFELELLNLEKLTKREKLKE